MTPEEHRARDLELRDRNHQDYMRLVDKALSVCLTLFVTVTIFSMDCLATGFAYWLNS